MHPCMSGFARVLGSEKRRIKVHLSKPRQTGLATWSEFVGFSRTPSLPPVRTGGWSSRFSVCGGRFPPRKTRSSVNSSEVNAFTEVVRGTSRTLPGFSPTILAACRRVPSGLSATKAAPPAIPRTSPLAGESCQYTWLEPFETSRPDALRMAKQPNDLAGKRRGFDGRDRGEPSWPGSLSNSLASSEMADESQGIGSSRLMFEIFQSHAVLL
jgi:hypothetical protein